jgi:hypothetical protein
VPISKASCRRKTHPISIHLEVEESQALFDAMLARSAASDAFTDALFAAEELGDAEGDDL